MAREGGQFDLPEGSFEGGMPENEVPLPPDHDTGSMRIPESSLDRFFDRELTRREAGGLFDSFRTDPDAARRFVQTQRMLDALREPVAAPDLSRAILARVDARTPMLSRRHVRHVRLGRMVAAAALVAVIAGAFVVQRLNPQIVEMGDADARPLASLRATMRLDAADAVNTVQQTAQAIQITASRALPGGGAMAERLAADGRADGDRHRASTEPVTFVRARLLPDELFPWRLRSAAPDGADRRVAWVVPCGTAPASASVPSGGCGSSLILIDLKTASADLPQTPQGRSSIAK